MGLEGGEKRDAGGDEVRRRGERNGRDGRKGKDKKKGRRRGDRG